LLFLTALFIAANIAGDCEAPAGTIYHMGEEVTADEMIETLEMVDIVFIGEKHDDPAAHAWELYIWNRLLETGRSLALEMFETDVQPVLDQYLAGGITDEEFLEGSRPWSNYSEDYAPMVELARERGAGVIAANVPRSYAAAVARGGWEAIEEEDFFQALSIDSSSALYRERFLATMEELGGQMHAMPMSPMNMYRAQLLKDAVMAYSVEGVSSVFVCGSFHSDYRSGIPDQLPSGTDFLTVKILAPGEPMDMEAADFLIVP